MNAVDSTTIFDEVKHQPSATEAELQDFVASTLRPLTRDEIEEIREESDLCDPANWTIPNGSFPADYLSLLRWANGADCRNGDRWIQFFPIGDPSNGVRAMMLAYHVPEYMPGAVPFAFSGGGRIYLFDMRQPQSSTNEYPIICADAGNLDFDDADTIADTFIEACRGTENVDFL